MTSHHTYQHGERVTVRRGATCRWGRVVLQEGDMVFVAVDGQEDGRWVNRSRLDYGVPEGCRQIRETA